MIFSTAIRKARDLGGRSLALARGPAPMVLPRGVPGARPHDAILVLQRGENASTDYYLRPRLRAEPLPWEVVDVRSRPEESPMLANPAFGSILVVVCRYISAPWLGALQEALGRVADLAFFADDDLPAMMADPALPLSVRGKVAQDFGQHAEALSAMATQVWLSTPALAQRYMTSSPEILPPLPEAAPAEVAPSTGRSVVYHGTDVHGPERTFALEVARRVRGLGCDAPFEITGDASLARAHAGLQGLTIIPQLSWPEYLQRNRRRSAALFLVPLSASRLNDARAPVKVFDAARLGATGLFADRSPYRDFVRDGEDGLLLPDDPDAWAAMIVELLADPDRRRQIAACAARRLTDLRNSSSRLPALVR